jgi:CBS domain-containing protein
MVIDHVDRISAFVSERWADLTEVPGLVTLIRAHGCDLALSGADPCSIERGTPVYADEDADPSRVLRRMAEAHVRFLFIVSSNAVVGVIDIKDLVERAVADVWPDEQTRNGTAPQGKFDNWLP